MSDMTEVHEIRTAVDGVLATRHDEIYATVRDAVAKVLAIDVSRITPDASLIDDLGAESLDFLDLVFQLETEYGVKIPRDGISHAARGSAEGEFEQNAALSDDVLERLRILMPEVPPGRIVPGLRTHQIASLFTVETFVRLVAWRLAK